MEGDHAAKDLVKRCLESEIPLHAGRHDYRNGTIFYCVVSDGFGNIGESNKITCPHLKESFVNILTSRGDYHRKNPCKKAKELQDIYRRPKNGKKDI